MADVLNFPDREKVTYIDRYRERRDRSWSSLPTHETRASLTSRLASRLSHMAMVQTLMPYSRPIPEEIDPAFIDAVSIEKAIADYTFPEPEPSNVTYVEFPNNGE